MAMNAGGTVAVDLISYDLVGPHRDYEAVKDHIMNTYGTRAKPLESVWLVKTSKPAAEIRAAARGQSRQDPRRHTDTRLGYTEDQQGGHRLDASAHLTDTVGTENGSGAVRSSSRVNVDGAWTTPKLEEQHVP